MGCVFCDIAAQPPAMFETEHVRVFPDLYPVVPGHVLVITKAHYSCLGGAPPEVLAEAEAAAHRVEAFQRRAFRQPVWWENGVAGQTVFHAHLHLIPVSSRVSLELTGDDWHPVSGLADLPAHFSEFGEYHFAAYGERMVVVDGNGPSSWHLRMFLAQQAGVKRIAKHYAKASGADEVETLLRLWSSEEAE